MSGLNLIDERVNGQKRANVDSIENIFNRYIPKGAISTYAFFTSYDGMSIEKLYEILMSLPSGNKLIREGNFDAVCGAKNKLRDCDFLMSDLILKNTYRKYVNGAFHSKIYLVQYEINGEKEWILILGSKNITKDSFLDAYVVFIGKYRQELDNVKANSDDNPIADSINGYPNGKAFYEVIKDYIEECDKILCDLCNIDFKLAQLPDDIKDSNPDISFIKPTEVLLKELCSGNSEDYPLYVISPFVKNVWSEGDNIRILSRKTELEKLKELPMVNGVQKAWYLQLIKEHIKETLELHAKIYIKHYESTTVLYIGSANFTHAAFSADNKEILARIVFSDAEADVYKKLINPILDDVEKEYWESLTETKGDAQTSDNNNTNRIVKKIYDHINDKLNLIEITIDEKSMRCVYSFALENCIIDNDVEVSFDVKPENDFIFLNGEVLFEYADKTYSYSFDIRDLIKKQGDEKLLQSFEAILDKKIKNEMEMQKKLILSGYQSKSLAPKKRKIGTDSKKYEAVVSDGVYEMIRKLVYKHANETNIEIRKKRVFEDVKNIREMIVDGFSEEEESFLNTLCEGKYE